MKCWIYTLTPEKKKWVLRTFNSENLTTTEAILSAVLEFGRSRGMNHLPIIVGIINTYQDRPQSVLYSQTRNWGIGLRLFLNDLDILTCEGSPFAWLQVKIHLDHIIWDEDLELLDRDMSQFSSIKYDASALDFEQNIEKTEKFVECNKDLIVIEGACDEISKAETSGRQERMN